MKKAMQYLAFFNLMLAAIGFAISVQKPNWLGVAGFVSSSVAWFCITSYLFSKEQNPEGSDTTKAK